MRILATILLFFTQQLLAQTISGVVKELGSSESLAGASCYILETKQGVLANKYGFYALKMPVGHDSITIQFSMVGYDNLQRRLKISSKDIVLNVEMAVQSRELETVTVKAEETKLSRTARMSMQNIAIQKIQDIPALFGEKDPLKLMQLIPGVQKGNDGNSTIFVRGGASDQNLLLLDDAPIYSLYHSGGFFSVFNGNALKRFEVMKGAFPARYGGRLSSVIEVQTRDGSKDQFHGSLGVGLLSSSVLLEGPIQRGKSSFLISARTSYLDKLYKLFAPKGNQIFLYGFYDWIAKLNFDLGPKDRLFVSNYFGNDHFNYDGTDVKDNSTITYTKKGGTDLNWGNLTTAVRWNHIFSGKMFANTSFIFCKYQFGYGDNITTGFYDNKTPDYINNATYQTQIRDLSFKTDIDYFITEKSHLRLGGYVTNHLFVPERTQLETSYYKKDTSLSISANEAGAYIEHELSLNENLQINAGLRFVGFLSPQKSYFFVEPRLSFSYLLARNWAFKFGYARMNQFVHLASNSGVGFPFDVWVPSTERIQPQQADQFSFGIVKDLNDKPIDFQIEVFYKKMNHLLAVREGATFFSGNTLDLFKNTLAFKETWEDKLTQGQGLAYGLELMTQKKQGRFSGWVSYTLSWVKTQFDELNFGQWFYPRYDRRNNLAIVGTYKIKPNITFSATWNYATGQRITFPSANFGVINHILSQRVQLQNSNNYQSLYEYSSYANFKTMDFHRLDTSIQFLKKKQNKERTWEIGIYNVYNRKNPFFYTFSKTQPVKLQSVSIMPLMGSVSYQLKF